MFDLYLRKLKGGQMLAWSAGAAVAVLQFCAAHDIPAQHSYIAAGVAALIACVLFFLNPKALDWVSPDTPDLQDKIAELMNVLRVLSPGATQPAPPRNFSAPPTPPAAAAPLAPGVTSLAPGVTLTPEESATLSALLARIGGGA